MDTTRRGLRGGHTPPRGVADMIQGWSSTRRRDLQHRVRIATRLVPHRRRAAAFGPVDGAPTIERILVINLERENQRRARMERELARLLDATGRGLHLRARRVAAVDARTLDDAAVRDAPVQTSYRLSDQLAIDPEPLIDIEGTGDLRIEMTRQEVAVALSHIRAWEAIAHSEAQFTLVVEDDVVPVFGFAGTLDRAWRAAHDNGRGSAVFDLLYVSYKAVGAAESLVGTGPVLTPPPGLWELSAYILSRPGARKLLGMLPVRGPVDMWVNQHFGRLDVLAVGKPALRQRRDVPSTNSYSIVPTLTKLGVISMPDPSYPSLSGCPRQSSGSASRARG